MRPRDPLPSLALILAAVAAALALVLRLDFGAMPEVTRFRDDAYYYFVLARSLGSGAGPVVSDGQWTSGVHPLWGALLAGAAWLFGPAAIPTVAQALGLCLHGATAALLGLMGGGRRAGWAVALLYLGNPFLLDEAQNGQETALSCLCLLLLWRSRRGGEPAFAAASLLAVLARSDLFGVVLALGIWRRRLLVPLFVLLFHLGLNRWLGGGWLQDSAAPVPWLLWNGFLATDPTWGDIAARLWWYLRPCLLGGPFALVSPLAMGSFVFLLLRPCWPAVARAVPLLLVAAAYVLGARDLQVVAWAALLLGFMPARRLRRPAGDRLALAAGLMVIVVLHYGLRQYPRDYYFAVLGIAGAIALLRLARPLPVLLVIAALLQGYAAIQPGRSWPGQEEMAMAGRFVERILPPGERIGCFNSGIVTWYHRDPVVNLDGAVNRPAFNALRRGALDDYLDGGGIRFLVDNPVQFSRDPHLLHASGMWFSADFDPKRDLYEIARFDVPGAGGGRAGTDSVRLYWRVGRGVAPGRAGDAVDLGPAPDGGRYVLWSGAERVELRAAPISGGVPSGDFTPLGTGVGGAALVVKVPPLRGSTVGLFAGGSRPFLQFPGL